MKLITKTIGNGNGKVYVQRSLPPMTIGKSLHSLKWTFPRWMGLVPVLPTMINIIFFINHSYKICPVLPS